MVAHDYWYSAQPKAGVTPNLELMLDTTGTEI